MSHPTKAQLHIALDAERMRFNDLLRDNANLARQLVLRHGQLRRLCDELVPILAGCQCSSAAPCARCQSIHAAIGGIRT